MATYGYDQGNPFGDPNKFTRSTGEDEINRYNEWMRALPEWQQARGSSTGDFNDQQKAQLTAALAAKGIAVPSDFHIDEGGNFNQKSRAKKIALYTALAGGAALTGGLGLAGMGPLGGVLGGSATVAAPTAGAVGGGLASTTIGTGMLPAIAGGTGLAGATAGGGAAAAAGIGSKLAGLGKSILSGPGLDAAGRAIGAYGQSQADNRGTRLAALQNEDQLRLAAEQNQRTAETDSMAKLANTNYIANPAAMDPAKMSKYGYGPQGTSDAQKSAAKLLEAELLKRMSPAGQFKLSDISDDLKPGVGERFANIAGPAASYASLFRR